MSLILLPHPHVKQGTRHVPSLQNAPALYVDKREAGDLLLKSALEGETRRHTRDSKELINEEARGQRWHRLQ